MMSSIGFLRFVGFFGGSAWCTAVSTIISVRMSTVRTCSVQIRPLEEAYKFGNFFSPALSESDFDAKPSVLLLGQYSTGAC